MSNEVDRGSSDPGVPEALPRTLVRLRERLGVEMLDRLWIFPPIRRGRREQGLIAVSVFRDGDSGRRGVVTVSYAAEHTGRGVTVEPVFTHEGEAPPDRFPSMMLGVAQRGGDERGEPREIEIDKSAVRFEEMLEEYDGLLPEVREA